MHQDDTSSASTLDLSLLSARLATLHTDVFDIKGTLKDLTAAINKLALVEERLTHTTAAQERTFKVIEKLEQRLDALERTQVSNDATSKWIDRGLVGLLGAFLAFIWERIRNG